MFIFSLLLTAGFWGDIALSDAEYKDIKSRVKSSGSSRDDIEDRFELQVEDPGIHRYI